MTDNTNPQEELAVAPEPQKQNDFVTEFSQFSDDYLRISIVGKITRLNQNSATIAETQADIESRYSEDLQTKLAELEAIEETVRELRKEVKELKQEEIPMGLNAILSDAKVHEKETKIVLGDLLSEYHYRNPDISGGGAHIFGGVSDDIGDMYRVGLNWTRSNGWHVVPELAHDFISQLTEEELKLFQINVSFRKDAEGVPETEFNTYAMVNKKIGRFGGLQLKPRVLVSPKDKPMLIMDVNPATEDMPAIDVFLDDVIKPSPLSVKVEQ